MDMSQPILRTGIPLQCPRCRQGVLQERDRSLHCGCGWSSVASAQGVLEVLEQVRTAEQVQRAAYDVLLEGLGQTADPITAFVSPHGLQKSRMLRRLRLKPGETVLEVACGAGPLSDALSSRYGCRCVGIDISAASVAAQLARRHDRSGWDAVVASATRLPFAAGTFDAVTAFDVIEHLAEPETLYAEAARVLKPGGRMLLRMPVMDFGWSADWWQYRLRHAAWMKRMDRAGHFYAHFRTKFQHKHLARAAGLRVLTCFGYDVFFDNLYEYGLLPRLAPRKQAEAGAAPEGGIRLVHPTSLKHRLARFAARVLDVALLPERLAGTLGFGASAWLLAVKPPGTSA